MKRATKEFCQLSDEEFNEWIKAREDYKRDVEFMHKFVAEHNPKGQIIKNYYELYVIECVRNEFNVLTKRELNEWVIKDWDVYATNIYSKDFNIYGYGYKAI